MTLERVLGSALAGLGATLFMEQDVELEVVPQGVTRAQPEELFVSFPAVATTDTADITGSFCCHVHFLAGAAAADEWREGRPDGIVFDVQTAYELGRRTVEPLLDATPHGVPA